MKRLLLSLMLLMASLLSFAHDFEVNGIYYNILSEDDLTCEVAKAPHFGVYTGSIVIPSQVSNAGKDFSVTSIGISAFHDCSSLTSITIPNSVTSIGANAFWNCSSMTSIDVPNSVTNIGKYSLSGCGNLEEIFVEEGNPMYDSRDNCNCIIETSKNEIIQGCKNSTIPNSVTSIGESAFHHCYGLTSVTIPNSVTSIGDYAFEGCNNLAIINIPQSVTSIGNSFNECASLPVEDGIRYADCVAVECVDKNQTTCAIKEGTRFIHNNAFFECAIQNITIPESATSIGDEAFRDCSSLMIINIPQSVTNVGNAFVGCTSLPIKNGIRYADCVAVEAIDKDQTTYSVSEETRFIHDNAFRECKNLRSITIPNSVTNIGNGVFWGCSSLLSIYIPYSVTSIGDNAFARCAFSSVFIPNSVTYIGAHPLWGCENLSQIIIEDGNPSYDSRDNCNCIIETAKNRIFQGCKESHIPNSITSIGNFSFYGCSGLKSINIPNSVICIEKDAFEFCYDFNSADLMPDIEEIIVEEGNPVYDSRENCNCLIETAQNTIIKGCKNSIIPESVTSLGFEAFAYFSGLTSIIIPGNVTSLKNRVFIGCINLNKIVSLSIAPPSCGEYDFYGVSKTDCVVIVPPESVEAYKAADGWKDFQNIIAIECYSPFAGNAVANGEEWYLYNVETGYWLGNNNHMWGDWTTRAQANPVGLDWKIEEIGGGWRLDPKYGHNNSMNSSNFYLDTNDDVTAWTFTETPCLGATKAYKISANGKKLGVVRETNDKQELGYQLDFGGKTDGTWVLVTREERLAIASESNPVDASFLIPCYDMGDNNPRFNWTLTSNGDASGPKVMWEHNRIWETWNVTAMDAYTNLTGIPNGKYLVYSIGAYVPTAGDQMNGNDYDDYKTNGSSTVHALAYANGKTAKMASVYSVMNDHQENERWTREVKPGVWVPSGWGAIANQCGHYDNYWSEPVEIIVTNGTLRIGVKMDGNAPSSSWVVFSGMRMKYLGEAQDLLTPALEALNNAIASAQAIDQNRLTDALKTALNTALSTAQSLTTSTDIEAISNATSALNEIVYMASPINLVALRATIALAKAEGIDVSEQEDYLVNGTTDRVEELLRLTRNLRKLNAIEKVDITKIECSEPTNAEADYYLYNVGAGVFFSTTADWGTHIAIDNPGMLIHFRPDGEWNGASGRPVFHLSGNGWDGMNWSEEYWDKDGVNKLAFVPVEGKDKVYNMCEWDNYNWHFVYDPADDVCDGGRRYWNAVQKREWNRNDYKDNPYAQWMLVSPAAYDAAMKKADESSPLDVTYKITNPNFTKDKIDGEVKWARGWDGVGGEMRGNNEEPWCVIEYFEASANLKQTVSGLPAGKYQVTAYGFYRDGSSDNEAGKVKRGEELRQLAKLVAINGNDERTEGLLPNVTSEAGNFPGVGETRDGVDGEFACWAWQANQYFQTGLYKATTDVIEVGADGELTIGVEYDHNGDNDETWVVVGNFRLTCLGVADKTTVTSAEYATYVAPFNISEIPDGVEAYAAQDMHTHIRLEPVSAIPAGEAVVLKNAGDYTFYSSATNVSLGTTNDLTWSATNVTADGSQYILAKKNDKVGFYKATTGSTIKSGKAFLVNTANINALYFDEDETSIQALPEDTGNKLEATEVYNLAGQRIQKMQRGVNIVNGKKVIF